MALLEEWGGGADWHGKVCESIIHDYKYDLWVTMVGWMDVPYSDWGDFRRRRAVDISGLFVNLPYNSTPTNQIWM